MMLLHVVSSMNPKLGGVSQAIRTTIAALATEGVQNEVVSLDAPGAPAEWGDEFPLQALGPARGPWGYSAQLLPWLTTHLKRFDAVVLHGLWLYHGYALHKAWRRLSGQASGHGPSGAQPIPRFFVMPHGMLDPYFQRAAGRKLKAWRNWLYWKVLEKSVVRDATGLLFTCETERQLAREPFTPYQPRQEIVVGLGVAEPPTYTAAMRAAFLAKCPAAATRPYLLFLSRIHEKKGVDLLLQAYAQLAGHTVPSLAAAAPTSPTGDEPAQLPLLVIAGPGLDSAYGEQMQEWAAKVPAPAAVYLPGMLTGDAKWGAFYGCEAFVLPSHQENFGIAVVEALACGKPVLISNQVNIWREIAQAGAGLVADDTAAGTQQQLVGWHELPRHDKQAMSQQAQQLYQNYFSVPATTQKLLRALT